MTQTDIQQLREMFNEQKKSKSKNHLITLIITVVGSCLISWLAIANTVVSNINRNESRINGLEFHTGNLCEKVYNYNPYETSRGGSSHTENLNLKP